MELEVAQLKQRMIDRQTETLAGLMFVLGTLDGRPVVLVHSGVGKVNAAMAATLLIERYQPAEVLFTGIGGGIAPDIRPGDIIIARKTTQHDFGDLSDQGFRPEMTVDPATGQKSLMYYPADERLVVLAQAAALETKLLEIGTTAGRRLPSVRTGIVATGDVFVEPSRKKKENQVPAARRLRKGEHGHEPLVRSVPPPRDLRLPHFLVRPREPT